MTTRPRPEAIPKSDAPMVRDSNQRPRIVSIRAPLSSCGEQDRIINEQFANGYQHYESVCIGGNEILLRFRLK